jgi:hypothetical protein
MTHPEPLSRAVVEAVAARDGIDPVDVETPLYEVVDPDALDALFDGRAGEVTFEYSGYRVTVTESGEVTLLGDGERGGATGE